jgi:hypothetical protein
MDKLKFQNTITKWQEETFKAASKHSIKAHLAEEMIELCGIELVTKALEKHKESGKTNEENDNEEASDIGLLLMHLSHKSNFNLLEEISIKFEKNKKRKWGKPDENGVVNHVKEQ